MRPRLEGRELVFCTFESESWGARAELEPVAAIAEREGLTLIVPRVNAVAAGIPHHGVFRMITLEIWSDLNAVGLTAAVAACLAKHGIAANLLAGTFHDHILVPAGRAEEALALLEELSAGSRGTTAAGE